MRREVLHAAAAAEIIDHREAWPSLIRRSTVCDPMKPAPPVFHRTLSSPLVEASRNGKRYGSGRGCIDPLTTSSGGPAGERRWRAWRARRHAARRTNDVGQTTRRIVPRRSHVSRPSSQERRCPARRPHGDRRVVALAMSGKPAAKPGGPRGHGRCRSSQRSWRPLYHSPHRRSRACERTCDSASAQTAIADDQRRHCTEFACECTRAITIVDTV